MDPIKFYLTLKVNIMKVIPDKYYEILDETENYVLVRFLDWQLDSPFEAVTGSVFSHLDEMYKEKAWILSGGEVQLNRFIFNKELKSCKQE